MEAITLTRAIVLAACLSLLGCQIPLSKDDGIQGTGSTDREIHERLTKDAPTSQRRQWSDMTWGERAIVAVFGLVVVGGTAWAIADSGGGCTAVRLGTTSDDPDTYPDEGGKPIYGCQ